MDKHPADEVVINALFKRFTKYRLPRACDLEKKVLAGGTLNELDLTFLNTVLSDAKYILKLSDKYPEYQKVVSQAIQLYADITQKALENENKNPRKTL